MSLRDVEVALGKADLLPGDRLILVEAGPELAKRGCGRLREDNDIIGISKVADF